MSKLVDKLEELGYQYAKYYDRWRKEILENTISIIVGDGQILHNEVVNPQIIVVTTQQQIDNLQQAFNEMQKDLKELELCQD